jgi:hypothetical protein
MRKEHVHKIHAFYNLMPSPGLEYSNHMLVHDKHLALYAILYIIGRFTAPGSHTSFKRDASMKPGFILTHLLNTTP